MSNVNDLSAEPLQPFGSEGKSRSKWATACLFIFLFICVNACATIAARRDHSDPLIRIAYSPGGDGPVVTLMYVYEGHLMFGEYGGHLSRRNVVPSALSGIRRELATGILADLDTSSKVGRHERELWIEYGDRKIGILLDSPPPSVVPLLKEVKDVFLREFGARFRYLSELLP